MTVTGTVNSIVFASNCGLICVTSPMVMPPISTGAPTVKPADGLLEDQQIGMRIVGGRPEGFGAVIEQGEMVSASAGGSGESLAGVSNATPPARMDMTDSVWTCRPAAVSDTSIPLACQNRVSGLTY